MTKLGFLTATALIALSPLAMAQSSNPMIPGGGYMVAQAQGQDMSQETPAAPYVEKDLPNWQEDNTQVPKD